MRAPFRFSCSSMLRVMPILHLFIFGSIALSTSSTTDENKKTDALSQARLLNPPTANASLDGEFESFEFWDNHGDLLREAWSILYQNHRDTLPPLHPPPSPSSSTSFSNHIFHPPLQQAVEEAWNTPTIETETNVKSQWTELLPNNNNNNIGNGGAYKCQLFTEEGVAAIRAYIDLVSNSGIPTRRPNGMNRFGFIFDEFDKQEERINGAVSLPPLSAFYSNLVTEYIRPMGRMFFPRYIKHHHHHDSSISNDEDEEDDANDGESFGFTIRYSQDEDIRLNEHSDASLYTLNVNLNLSGEGYSNSSIYFVNGDEHITTVEFDTPGMAVLHKGSIRHGANPIVDGNRVNLVIWLFGKDGYVRVAPYQDESECMTLEERWSRRSSSKRNGYSIEKENVSLAPTSLEL